jgi:quercetin dioxygenase-like cupin family protein
MIYRWNPDLDGELNEHNMRRKLEALGYQVNKYVYPPGTCFDDHSHSIDKIDGVVAGRFRMTMHGESTILEPGDCLAVAAGVTHSAQVVGNQSVVSLDAVRKD